MGDAYRDDPRDSFSGLKWMDRSPASYRWHRDHPTPQTDAMRIGDAVHLAVLQPERCDFAIWEGGRRAGKEWQDFVASTTDRTRLTREEAEEVSLMAEATDRDELREYITGSAEMPIFWEACGVRLKSRLDMVTASGCIVDLKTTKDASRDAFGRQSWSSLYHVQGAMYVDAYFFATGKVLPYALLAVEKEPPYQPALYVVGDALIRAGRETYMGWLERLKHCEASGEWPGYELVQYLQPPRWSGIDSYELEEP